MNPDFRDILSVFSDGRVEFMVVGAYAMAFHGLPRATGDIDLWVNATEENSVRVLKALARFGAPIADLSTGDLQRPGVVFQFGVEPRRIDILTSIDGVAFEDAASGVVHLNSDGLLIPVIGKDHLLRNKQASGRPQDLVDAAWLNSQQD